MDTTNKGDTIQDSVDTVSPSLEPEKAADVSIHSIPLHRPYYQ